MSRPTTTTRQNEYFVPRDGIDREVISADICRYLGNDALVRPGHYENPQTGQPVQGYYITAYRNLTTAMIEDLKADSARWDRERRAQTSRNTTGVQYRYSETHQSRQHLGPTEPPYQQDHYAREAPYDGPRYPGSGAPGYTGAGGQYQKQQQQQGYAPPSGGGYGGGYQQPPQQSPGPVDARYASPPQAGSMMNPGYQGQDAPYVSTGANMPPRAYSSDPYANNRMPSVSAPPQPTYISAPPPQQGYPAPAYQYQNQTPPPGPGAFSGMPPPQDPYFGRASPAGQAAQPPSQPQAFAAPGQQQQNQYEANPQTRATPPAADTQTSPRDSSNRRSDRDTDMLSSERTHRPPPHR